MAKKHRDGLFRDYFSDKRRLLELCNLLTGEDATDPDEMEINTLDGVFFDELNNYISCLFRDRILVMVTKNNSFNEEALLLDFFFYVTKLLRQYVNDEQLYREELVMLPTPKFFVFYNGDKKEVARREMRLSDTFGKKTCLEVVVQFYNLNEGMNEEFISQTAGLDNYCLFVNRVKKSLATGLDINHAIADAFDYCTTHGIMAEYLSTKKKDLASMLAMEFDPVAARQAWREAGLAEGREEKALSIAKNLLAMKLSVKDIMKATGCTEEQILKLAELDKV